MITQIRLNTVTRNIENAPIIISDLAESGYTKLGTYGHGKLVAPEGFSGWVIYDLPDSSGLVKKVCSQSLPIEPQADLDFFTYNDAWFKIRSGEVTLTRKGWIANPPTHNWKGIIPSKLVFDVNNMDIPYSGKVLLGKLLQGSMSPREYVMGLKKSNPSCFNIPLP